MTELQGKQKPNQKNTKKGTEDNEGISLEIGMWQLCLQITDAGSNI